MQAHRRVCYGGGVSGTKISRGEYKTPGGKLVAVTVSFDSDGTVQSCQLYGDFFVDAPDDAASEQYLQALTKALITGQSLQSIIDEYPNCQLIGTDAAAIATAFARAVSGTDIYKVSTTNSNIADIKQLHTTISAAQDAAAHDYAERWESLKRNLIVLHDHPRTPAEQMQIDETWAREVAMGKRSPTLRIWEWAEPAVVIGRFQSAPDEVNLDVAERLGFDVVRRCTGGGAMFIEPGNTITYSLYVPLEFVQNMSIEESYRLCDWWLVEALHELGLDVRFSGLNDIASQYGKIGGAAQRRFPVTRAGAVLHHVTMAYDIDAAKMGQVLNTSREKLSDKAVKSAKKRVDPLKSQTGLSREQIIDHLLHWFA
ncbi:lipoate--protein ligase family protein [Bifidobacterium imperatoris]|uniref:Lipoate--protein ligase family protein n=1 Tax=Bifidobacterium imperatoris TaxID=2020965 RepID=A0ABX7S2T6_9BIFI|nr:lipoate--protein ligase family protein [Bifidobacterium imperatoris]